MTGEICFFSRVSDFLQLLSICLISLIRLSLYESSIRSSVPPRYGSLVLYLSHSTKKEALCKISSAFTPYPWVFIMPMSPEGAYG